MVTQETTETNENTPLPAAPTAPVPVRRGPPPAVQKPMNAVMRPLLRSPLHRLVSGSVMLLSFSGRKSGRRYDLPITYVREGDTVLAFCWRYRTWWKNLRGGVPVTVRIAGRDLRGTATVRDDPEAIARGVASLVRLAPQAARFYGIKTLADGRPDADTVAQFAANAVMIEVALAPAPAERGGLTISKGLPRRVFNRVIAGLLHSPLHGLFGMSGAMMLLTYTGRKSGTAYTLPLAYLREGDTVTTVALFANTVWWKNLRGGTAVTLRLRGRDVAGVAEAVEEPGAVADGLLAMNAASGGRGGGYYAVPRTPDGQPDRDALLEMARTRVLVRVALAAPA